MSRYKKGYRREKQAKELLEDMYGYVCVDSRKSHGIADMVCGNGSIVLVIQVKNPKDAPYVNWEELARVAHALRGIPLVMSKIDYGIWKYYRFKGDKGENVLSIDTSTMP